MSEQPTWINHGVVTDIDKKQGVIEIWLDGFDGAQVVPIDPAMPEWLFVIDTSFKVKIPRQWARDKEISEPYVWSDFEFLSILVDEPDELAALKQQLATVTARLDAAVALLGEVGEPYFRDSVEDPKNCSYCYGWKHKPDCLTVRIRAFVEGVK